jgi:hypothetical protein
VALKPKHRREIRDLLRILYDDRVWQPHHTDRLLNIVRECRSDVAEEIEKQTAADYAAMKQEQMALRKRMSDELHEVEQLREGLKSTHAKVAALLETLIDLPIAKAMVQDQDGNMVLDHTLISDKDAKVALSAAEKILKVTGAMVPPKVEVDLGGGNAFDLLDAVEVDAEDA